MSSTPGSDERCGRVVCASESTFPGLEETAKLVEAKGVYFDRGAHRQERKIAKWLEGHEEDDYAFGEFAATQVQVALPRPDAVADCDDSDCDDTACQDKEGAKEEEVEEEEEEEEVKLAGPAEIREACEQLVAELPASFREAVRSDAEAIAGICVRLCPEVPFLTLRLEIIQHHACWRWHQDGYTSRAIVSYVGPGTCAADDKCVRWDEFARTAGDETNESCVPAKSVKQMTTNSVLLMKGDAWPGIRGRGLTHKSPEVLQEEEDDDEEEGLPPKRLLLKVDLNDFRPPIGDDGPFGEEEDYDEEEEEEEEEKDSADMKRPSEDSTSANKGRKSRRRR